VSADEVGVAPESTNVIDLNGEIQFPFLLEFSALGLGQGVHDQGLGHFIVEAEVFKRFEHAIYSRGWGCSAREMEVGASVFDGDP